LNTGDASQFKVRASGYKKTKQKRPSDRALFDQYGGDCVISDGPADNFSSKMYFPPLNVDEVSSYKRFMEVNEEVMSSSTKKSSIALKHPLPSYFVVNMQIPTVGKPLFGAKRKLANQGPPPTLNAVYYFKISPQTASSMALLMKEELSGKKINYKDYQITNAEVLVYKWFRDISEDPIMNGRFKAIGLGHNFDEIGAPGFIKGYNGKPVLFSDPGRSGNRKGFSKIVRGLNYLELDIDVAANFSFLAQKGIVWGLGISDKLDSSLGFVIEV
jgi:hypothetical protein